MGGKVPMTRVGFYDPFSVYESVSEILGSQVRLVNLHWRASADDPLRSIPELPIKFDEETPKQFDNSPIGPTVSLADLLPADSCQRIVNLTSIPHVRLMLITSDGIDSYRAKVRPLITEWKKSCVDKAHGPMDWYIVYVADDSKAHAKVFDKLKVDFETETDRRCFFLRSDLTATETNGVWAQLNAKLKESILSTLTSRLHMLVAELERLIQDGIEKNFDLILITKEAIASEFLMVNLFEDALGRFDDLSYLITTYQDKIYGDEVWSDDNSNLVENYMSAPRLFTKDTPNVSQFALKAYVFTRVFKIFESLADASPSLSLASLHIAEFLHRLELFIADVTRDFAKSNNKLRVQEWAYKFIDEVMSLDLCVRIASAEDDESHTAQLSERSGQLLLLQRSKLLEVGQHFDYYIHGALTDLTLDPGNSESDITYSPLRTILSTRENFEEQFVSLTETAIGHFNVCDRPRSVDALSIDIALLDYHNERYEKAAMVLSTCPDFYGSQGWQLIGTSLLEAYIGCLENLADDAAVFQDGDGAMERDTQLLQSFIAVLALSKTSKGTVSKTLISKAIDYLSKSERPHTMPFNKLFEMVSSTHVTGMGDGRYELIVTITNQFDAPITINDIKLGLENTEGDTLEFARDMIALKPGENDVSLATYAIQPGAFSLAFFNAKFGSTELPYTFELIKKTGVFIIDSSDLLTVDVVKSSAVDLGAKPFSVIVDTPTEIRSVELHVWRSSSRFSILDDCKIKTRDSEKLENLQMSDNSIVLGMLRGPAEYEIIIPYSTIESHQSSIEVYALLSYEIDGIKRSYTAKSFIESSLSIGVSVQDIFKTNHLYCKFSVGTSEPEHPIRVVSADLQPNENYAVDTALKSGPVVAFGEQPANYFFQITSKSHVQLGEEDSLKLIVKYREIKHEALQVWSEHIHQQLKKASLEKYSKLLDKCSESINFDYGEFISEKTLSMSLPEGLHLRNFQLIPFMDRQKVYDIFSKCLEAKYSFDDGFQFQDRRLTINVQIPIREVIHNVEIKLVNPVNHVFIGEEIEATLEISSVVCHGSKKRGSSGKKVQFAGEESPINRYSIEVSTNQESWLVNGKIRQVIELDKSVRKTHEFPSTRITLIPLRVGKLLLPKIQVENLSITSKNEQLMEVDYKNENETIFVVSQNT